MSVGILLVDDDETLRMTRQMILGDWPVLPTCSQQALSRMEIDQSLEIVFIGQSVPAGLGAEIARAAIDRSLGLLMPEKVAAAAGEARWAAKVEVYSPPLAPVKLLDLVAGLSAMPVMEQTARKRDAKTQES